MQFVSLERLRWMVPLATITLVAAVAFIIAAPTGPTRELGDPIGNYNFRVEIEGVGAGQFTAVDGLSAEQEVIEFRSGDDLRTHKIPGRVKYSNITLKRGYVADDIMHDWIKQSLLNGQLPDTQRKPGAIIVLDNTSAEIVRYNFFDAWPCEWKGPTLDSKGGGALTEEIVICVEWFEEAQIRLRGSTLWLGAG